MPGTCGIGHTRWATHGEPSESNAHPHCSDDRSVVLVHNGIIENYQETEGKAVEIRGTVFILKTDTEIAVKLIDYYYKKTGTPLEAMSRDYAPYPWLICFWGNVQGLSGKDLCRPQGQPTDRGTERYRRSDRF